MAEPEPGGEKRGKWAVRVEMGGNRNRGLGEMYRVEGGGGEEVEVAYLEPPATIGGGQMGGLDY